MKRFFITILGLIIAGFFVACSANKEKPTFTQDEVDFYKTHVAEREAEDKRCAALAEGESEFDKKCLTVAEAHHQLLTEDYTHKGAAPDMSFNPYAK